VVNPAWTQVFIDYIRDHGWVHGWATDLFSGSRATLQGYNVSHYTFLVY
jgi:hypothetical protein